MRSLDYKIITVALNEFEDIAESFPHLLDQRAQPIIVAIHRQVSRLIPLLDEHEREMICDRLTLMASQTPVL